jgi:hypothetical protein
VKLTVSLHDIVKVKLTNLGALKYNARATKGMSKEELKAFFYGDNPKNKNEGDYLEGNLYLILSLLNTSAGDIDIECFQNEEFEVVSY